MKEIFKSKTVMGFIIFVLGFTYLMSVKEVNELKKPALQQVGEQVSTNETIYKK